MFKRGVPSPPEKSEGKKGKRHFGNFRRSYLKFRPSSPDPRRGETGRRTSEEGPSTTSGDDLACDLPALPVLSIPGSEQEQLSSASNPATIGVDRRLSAAAGYTSVFSSALTRLLSRQRTNHEPEPDDPLGLIFIHGVPQPSADIIFVHGLGGSSLRTWSWQRRPEIFWPAWIRQEEGLSNFRVFSYGYNANFKESENPLSLLDFSKGLLLGMKTYGHGEADGIGQVSLTLGSHICIEHTYRLWNTVTAAVGHVYHTLLQSGKFNC